jgi:hypothetical protein
MPIKFLVKLFAETTTKKKKDNIKLEVDITPIAETYLKQIW